MKHLHIEDRKGRTTLNNHNVDDGDSVILTVRFVSRMYDNTCKLRI